MPTDSSGAWARSELGRHAELLGPEDLALLLRLVRQSQTWAYVDGLAGDAVGTLVLRHPDAAAAPDAWAR
ncbi:MAG: DNA alkylation repair protein, partial [Actinobacteria bacterium]|nr:DNA alkylation repair protein [Actinomycetota bacterium]